MKRLVLALAISFVVPAAAHAQGLQKGNLIGTHLMKVQLAPGVTMEQFAKAYQEKMIPAIEKNMPGWKVYLVKRVRGEQAEGLAAIFVVRSAAERDKYDNPDGSENDLGKAKLANVAPVLTEVEKLGKITADVYTDWIVY